MDEMLLMEPKFLLLFLTILFRIARVRICTKRILYSPEINIDARELGIISGTRLLRYWYRLILLFPVTDKKMLLYSKENF